MSRYYPFRGFWRFVHRWLYITYTASVLTFIEVYALFAYMYTFHYALSIPWILRSQTWNSWSAFLSSFLGINSSPLRFGFFVLFSTLSFPFYKTLFMKRLEFSCFADFFVRILKPEKSMVFFLKSASRRHCEQHGLKDSNLWKIYVQEFHLRRKHPCGQSQQLLAKTKASLI